MALMPTICRLSQSSHLASKVWSNGAGVRHAGSHQGPAKSRNLNFSPTLPRITLPLWRASCTQAWRAPWHMQATLLKH
eukprot:5909496-Amphidinium_carterae.1